jgi:hypothetical protein
MSRCQCRRLGVALGIGDVVSVGEQNMADPGQYRPTIPSSTSSGEDKPKACSTPRSALAGSSTSCGSLSTADARTPQPWPPRLRVHLGDRCGGARPA